MSDEARIAQLEHTVTILEREVKDLKHMLKDLKRKVDENVGGVRRS